MNLKAGRIFSPSLQIVITNLLFSHFLLVGGFQLRDRICGFYRAAKYSGIDSVEQVNCRLRHNAVKSESYAIG